MGIQTILFYYTELKNRKKGKYDIKKSNSQQAPTNQPKTCTILGIKIYQNVSEGREINSE